MRKIEITTLKLNYIVYWKERRGAHLDKLISVSYTHLTLPTKRIV